MNGRTARRSQRLLLIEAGLAVGAASALIRTVRFARIARAAAGRSQGGGRADVAGESRCIARAIEAWARRLPWSARCFEQGLAAHWMLRRRGLASTLFYGAATIDGQLKAHVWVRSGEIDVIGCDNAGDYAPLASFASDE